MFDNLAHQFIFLIITRTRSNFLYIQQKLVKINTFSAYSFFKFAGLTLNFILCLLMEMKVILSLYEKGQK